jgi:endogenous inhibitor of DNA gyrase (YacG/DUF329 family)
MQSNNTHSCADCGKPVKKQTAVRCRGCAKAHTHRLRSPRPCPECGTHVDRSDQTHCSRACYDARGRSRRAEWEGRRCEWCDSPFEWLPGQGAGRFCSRDCAYQHRRRPSIDNKGYRWVWNGNQKIMEHRLVMSRILGRPLITDEHVHHINEDPLDNRPENLQVLSQAEHTRLHKAKRV